MAFNIIKHRRGTTQEWLDLNLTPESGEIVIEECVNGLRKCKIGDGTTSFDQLPYVGAETQEAILEELRALGVSFEDKLTKTKNSILEQITTIRKALSDDIISSTNSVISGYTQADQDLQKDFDTKLTTTAETLLTAQQRSVAELDRKLNAEIAATGTSLDQAITHVTFDLLNSIDQLDNRLSKKIDVDIENTEKHFSDMLSAESSIRTEKELELVRDLASVETLINDDIKPAITKLDAAVKDTSETLTDTYRADVNRLEKQIADQKTALEGNITQTKQQIDKNIEDTAEDLQKVFDADLDKTKNDLQNLIVENHTEVTSAIDNVTMSIAASELRCLNSLADACKELKKTDSEVIALIDGLKAQNQVESDDLSAKLKTIHEHIQVLTKTTEGLLTKTNATDTRVTNVSNDVAKIVNDIQQQHNKDLTYISSEIKALEDTRKTLDLVTYETLLEYVRKIYREIDDLVDDDITIIRRVFQTEAALNKEIADLGTQLTEQTTTLETTLTDSIKTLEEHTADVANTNFQTLSDTISLLNSDLTGSLETLKSNFNLSLMETRLDLQQASARIQENKEIIDSELDSLDSKITLNKAAINLLTSNTNSKFDNMDSKIAAANDKIDVQSKRISNIISLAQGSTTGDAELADIRSGYNGVDHESAGDAVRAIGNELEALRNSLPDYIPANAIDGLLYEDNLLYLTSDGVPVSDPVEITGGTGGGSGSISTVKVQNNLPSNSFTIAKGNVAEIDFTYTSFENGVPTGEGTYFVTINSKRIDALSGTIQHDIAKQFDVSTYLKNGSNNIKVTCTDQYGASRSLVYNISVIELRISSSFDSTRIFEDSAITFRYKVAGQIEKTVHVFLDDKEISTKTLAASAHNTETTLNIPKQSHGRHKLVAYMTASLEDSEDTIYSNELVYEILCVEPGEKMAMLASVFGQQYATQGDLLSIPYQVYDPSTLTTDVKLTVYSEVDGTEYSSTTATVGRGLSYWNTRQYPTGRVTFKISYTYDYYGETKIAEKEHTIYVEALKDDITPEEDGLQLYLTSQGRANTDAIDKRTSWTFKAANTNEPEVTTLFENFNWSTNGWVKDSAEDICLRLNGDARATIDFKPFAKDFKEFGKTIEFEFSVRDVNNRDAVVIDCFDGVRGFRATTDTAFLDSGSTKVTCRYKDEERIRIALTVEDGNSGSTFVSIYLDGILSGIQKYDKATDSYRQTSPLPITIGSSLCGVDIYSIRVYDKALSAAQILNNYIADKAEPSTRLKLRTDNDLLDSETGELSYTRVKELGQIPIITFTGTMPTYKGDKKKNSVYMTFEDPVNKELSFSNVLLKEIDVQGTSSAGYVRKNWKIKFNEKHRHMPGAIPAKVFCIKVDYAEATGTHNTGTANYVETLYDRNQSLIPAQSKDPLVRTTIQGFPCVIFEKASEDAEPVFSSKGNFNYDKGAEDVFGFNDENAEAYGVECWEFCNNISDSVSFLGPIPDDWKDDFEPRYTPIKSASDPDNTIFDDIEDLIEARENAAKGSGVFTEAQQRALSTYQATCIKNFKELHDWVLSTATYKLEAGSRVSIVPKNDTAAAALENASSYLLPSPITYAETEYLYDTEEYRLAKFKNEFADHFDMHYATMYYVFTFFALMVDQRAKNMFLTRWKNPDGKYRWYPYFYDNDTIFGINNVGSLVFDYYHEDIDQIASSDVYNGQNSTLWNNFRICFANEIEDLYRTLRSDGKITYDKIIDQYVTKGSDKWSAVIYNADAEYKYVCMARPAEDGTFDATNLKQVRGPGEHHLRYFIANRINYCDSKWFAGDYRNDKIVVRLYTPKTTEITDSMTPEQKAAAEAANARILESQEAVKASSKIKVTPYSAMYAGVAYASGTPQLQRLSKGESYEFSAAEGVNTNDAETDIYGASLLSSLGDLSNLYCDYIDLSNATKLINLKIGHADSRYHNDNIKSVKLGSNRLLKTIDVRNCSGLGVAGDDKTLSLINCQNIENIYAEGTNLAAVSLPIGGYIKTLHLPATINSLVIQDHKYITDFSIASFENVRTLRIEDCPTLDTKAMLESCYKDNKYTVEYAYLTGFTWGSKENPVSVDFIKSLIPVFDGDRLISGVLGLNDKGEATTNPAYLSGTCYVDEITGEDYTTIARYFPYLKIKFGSMTSNVTFEYTDASGETYQEAVEVTGRDSVFGNCTIPELSPAPAWAENQAFTYSFAGWSVNKQVCKGLEDSDSEEAIRKLKEDDFPDAFNGSSLKNINGDRTLYPVYIPVRKSYKVTFINPTAPEDSKVLLEVMVPYGNSIKYADYVSTPPKRLDAANPDLYECTGWLPDSVNIIDNLECYAQFAFLDSKWTTIDAGNITGCTDYEGKPIDGYRLNTHGAGTMTILACKKTLPQNPAVRVPDSILINDSSYLVKSLGGFDSHKNLELVDLPEGLLEIRARGFANCINLFEIDLPENLQTIGNEAFQTCERLKEISIPAKVNVIGQGAFSDCISLKSISVAPGNTRFKVVDDCLIDIQAKTLIQGLNTSTIPSNQGLTTLGNYCFAHTDISDIIIPEGITLVSSNAFNYCNKLETVTLPSTIKTLYYTCFSWCPKLKNINLPEGLQEIYTYVFNATALENVTIPASVRFVKDNSFSNIKTLKTVTFAKNTDGSGNIIIPDISPIAFDKSGSTDYELEFRVPWSAGKTPAAPWGAINAKVIYDYEEA
jgi:hypothetical protein